MRRPRLLGDLSVARQILVLQVGLVLVLVVSAIVLATYDARRDARASAAARSVSVAEAVADSPSVRRAVQGPDPSRVIQP